MRQAVLVLLVAAVPAWLSHRYVEDPIRRGRTFAGVRRGLAVGASGMLTAVAAGVAVVISFSLLPSVALASPQEAPGAAVLDDPAYADTDWAALDHVDRMRPTPLRLRLALPTIYDTDCVVPRDSGSMRACEFGRRDAEHTVVLVGDSKALQWFTPVRNIARQQGWRLVVIGKNGCQFADAIHLVKGHRNPSCESWTRDALDKIQQLKPDVVLTSNHYTTASPVDDPDAQPTLAAMADGLAAYWTDVLRTGSKLVVLLDNPGPDRPMPECVHENLDHLSRCTFKAVRPGGAPAQRRALRRVPRATVIDMNDVICPGRRQCPPVIGNVMVYRDGSHITDQYATSATPQFSARLNAATGGLLGTS